MDNVPTAPAEAPKAPESVETPTNTTEPVQAPAQAPAQDMHGFTSEDLAGMRKFIDNNGGWEKIKSRISNPQSQPQPQPQPQEQPQTNEPTSQPQAPAEPQYKTPAGAITAQEFLAEQYFKSLSSEEKYANISEGIRNGDYLKEMSAFGISALNQDGSINDQKVRMYLDLKAQTVPAKPTGAEPNSSNAPTVSYTEVGDNGITDINQAYKILMESGNPNISKAEEYIRNAMNPNSQKKQ